MTGENQKDLLPSPIHILKIHLAVPKHDVVLVIILKHSDYCFRSIG